MHKKNTSKDCDNRDNNNNNNNNNNNIIIIIIIIIILITIIVFSFHHHHHHHHHHHLQSLIIVKEIVHTFKVGLHLSHVKLQWVRQQKNYFSKKAGAIKNSIIKVSSVYYVLKIILFNAMKF